MRSGQRMWTRERELGELLELLALALVGLSFFGTGTDAA